MTVKYFNSAMVGAPALSGTAGSLIAVLDACLVDGFGLGTVDSVVVASNVATVTRNAGHPFQVGMVALIAGATPAGLNGDQRVLSVTATTYTFATSGISDQTATGTITHKVSPAGWSNSSVPGGSATLKVYKATDGAALGRMLRVDDSANYHARVVGYETMSDVNTGTGPFPTAAQFSGGGYWPRSNDTTSAVREWHIVADKFGFYFVPHFYSSFLTVGPVLWFGDIVPQGSGDTAHCLLQVYNQAGNSNYSVTSASSLAHWTSSASQVWASRAYTGIGGSVDICKFMDMQSPGSSSGTSGSNITSSNLIPYPNGSDNGLLLAPMRAVDLATYTLRGWFPGLYGIPQKVANGQFSAGDSVGAVPALAGRTIRMFRSMSSDSTNMAHIAIDCTGPWR